MLSGWPARWVVMGVFVLSSALNYLDRQILAQLAPVLKAEFGLTNRDFGAVLSAFSLVYAAASPLAGVMIDRLGLNRGISIVVGCWSLAGMVTGLANGFASLLASRAALGLFQAGGVPAAGKAIRSYLLPEERAVGQAASQLGLSLGAALAPPLATALALRFGWRSAFFGAGVLGLLWIPLWWCVSRGAPAQAGIVRGPATFPHDVLQDRRLWVFAAANVLGMTVYTLWTNWTTLYLVQVHHMLLGDTAWLAGVPPLMAPLGGFLGGWMSMRLIQRGMAPLAARYRACLLSAAAMLVTALVPAMPAPAAAVLAIGVSFLFAAAFSVNMYAMPLDAFPPERAAFGVSILTGAYGAMQTVFSPLIGAMVDRFGFGSVCLVLAWLPLAGVLILRGAVRR